MYGIVIMKLVVDRYRYELQPPGQDEEEPSHLFHSSDVNFGAS